MVIVVYFVVLAAGVLPPDRPAAAAPCGRAPRAHRGARGRRRGRHHRRHLRHRSAGSTTTRSSSRSRRASWSRVARGAIAPGRPTRTTPGGTIDDADAGRQDRASDRREPCVAQRRSSSIVTLVVVSARSLADARVGNTAGARPRPPGRHLGGAVAGRQVHAPTSLDVAVDIIRNRVDSLGVAEPEITRQGNDIVVDLPGREGPRQGRARWWARPPSCGSGPVLAAAARRRPPQDDDHRPRRTTTTAAGATAPRRRPPRRSQPDDATAAGARSPSCDRRRRVADACTEIPTTTRAERQARRRASCSRQAAAAQRVRATTSGRPGSPARDVEHAPKPSSSRARAGRSRWTSTTTGSTQVGRRSRRAAVPRSRWRSCSTASCSRPRDPARDRRSRRSTAPR